MRSKRRVIGIIIAVVFVFLMSTFLLSNNLIEAQETKDKQFTSIQVQKGDTLWKIAKKYMGNEYSSVTIILKRYVRQIIYMMERSQKTCIW